MHNTVCSGSWPDGELGPNSEFAIRPGFTVNSSSNLLDALSQFSTARFISVLPDRFSVNETSL